MTFQQKLKNETKIKHDLAEQHEFNAQLMQDKLSDRKYFVYLQNIYPIYDYIEKRLNFSGELIRSNLILADILQYSRQGHKIDENELYYFDWINNLAQKSDLMLLSEVYVEWLKDLYGGQIISKHIKYSTSLKFNDIPKTISAVRLLLINSLIENDEFIEAVNKTYDFHYNLLENIMV
jgi:heme oxygenase